MQALAHDRPPLARDGGAPDHRERPVAVRLGEVHGHLQDQRQANFSLAKQDLVSLFRWVHLMLSDKVKTKLIVAHN